MHVEALLTLAQTAGSQTDGVSYGLLLSVIAVEATLSGLTWASFNAESRLEKDRDRDVREATAGYQSGRVIPALATLIEEVMALRRDDEELRDTLARADTSLGLSDVVTASTASSAPRDLEGRLVKAWTTTGVACLVVQLSGPVLLLNHIANRDLLSDTLQTAALVTFIAAIAILGTALVFVRQLSRALTRAIRSGKDAASEA
jgi:hypothetical protein